MSARRLFSPGRIVVLGLLLLAVVLGLAVFRTNQYLFLPDRAHPVAPLVSVPGGHDPVRGGFYYVDVRVQKASWLDRLFPSIHSGASLYPAADVNPPCVSDTERNRIDLHDMQVSQDTAAAVALRALGRKVTITPTGTKVAAIAQDEPADCKLEPDDVITAVNGERVTGPADIFRIMRTVQPGAVVAFTVVRGGRTLLEHIKTVASTTGPRRAIVGFAPEQAVDIHLPIQVRIDAGAVGGPSAGLAFALDVMEQSGRDILHGLKVAATGEIFLNGAVGAIGGIEQKTIGARRAGVDVFLVPAGDNARDARKYAHGLRIIPVETFQQALHALATLAPAR